jgi:hypothetical protein
LVNIPKVAQDPYFDTQSPYYLQYTLHDSRGEIIQPNDDPFFAIIFNINITDPIGNLYTYEMNWNSEDNLYQSTQPLSLPTQGEYLIKMEGQTHKREYPYGPLESNETKEVVFNSSRLLFTHQSKFNVVCPSLDLINNCPWETYTAEDGCQVCPIKKFDIQIESPEYGQELGSVHGILLNGWPLPVNPFDFSMRFMQSPESGFLMDEILNNPDAPFRITLQTGDQERILDYKRDTEDPNRFIGTVKDLEYEGSYDLTVELTSGYNKYFSPEKETASITFSRSDGPWNKSSTYRNILFIFIVLLVLFILYQISIRNNKVRGELVFRDGDLEPRFSLNSRKNWIILKSKVFDQYPQLDLAYLKVSSLPKPKRKKTKKQMNGDDQLIDQDLSINEPEAFIGVRITIKTKTQKQKINFELPPNQPADYSDTSNALMEYEPPK